jgi:hypothetical protein
MCGGTHPLPHISWCGTGLILPYGSGVATYDNTVQTCCLGMELRSMASADHGRIVLMLSSLLHQSGVSCSL